VIQEAAGKLGPGGVLLTFTLRSARKFAIKFNVNLVRPTTINYRHMDKEIQALVYNGYSSHQGM